MAQTAQEIFVVGLRNAHAMETQARELMERQSERLDEYPEVKAKVTAHLQETNEQLKRLEQCLDALGEATSTLKDTAQSVTANVMAMTHAMAGDEILKNTFANNAFENFEIAALQITSCALRTSWLRQRTVTSSGFAQGRGAGGKVDRCQC